MCRKFCLLPPLSVSHVLYNFADIVQGLSFYWVHQLKQGQFTLDQTLFEPLFLYNCPQGHCNPFTQLSLHFFFFCIAFSKCLSTPGISFVSLSSLILWTYIFFFFSSYDIIPQIPCPVSHDLLTCLWNQSEQNLHSSFLNSHHRKKTERSGKLHILQPPL